MTSTVGYLEDVRATLRVSTTLLQAIAILAWLASLLLNPEVPARADPVYAALLVAMVATCVWKGRTASVNAWRLGTIVYGALLALAFRVQFDRMQAQSELFVLPLTILLSVGFAGVVPLRRDFLLTVALVWSVMLVGRTQILPPDMHRSLVALLIAATVLVSLGLNHAIVLNLRTSHALKENFRHLSEIDTLTRLPNRRALFVLLEVACAGRQAEPWHFAMLDMDDFKRINDRFGHGAGDAALLALADVLRRLPRGNYVGRLGGEEFGLLARNVDRAGMEALAQRVLADVRALRVHGLPLTLSAGLTSVTDGDTPADVLRRADQALYRAKHEGKDRALWHDATPAPMGTDGAPGDA